MRRGGRGAIGLYSHHGGRGKWRRQAARPHAARSGEWPLNIHRRQTHKALPVRGERAHYQAVVQDGRAIPGSLISDGAQPPQQGAFGKAMAGGQAGSGNPARAAATPAMLIAGAVGLLALPSAVLAFSSRFDSVPLGQSVAETPGTFKPGSVDPRLARAIASQQPGEGGLFRFTPAGSASRPDRSVTVAVRVDPETARAITVRGTIRGMVAPSAQGIAAVQIAPTAYNLSLARVAKAPVLGLGADVRQIDMPDLAAYRPSSGPAGTPSRFTPRLSLDEREKTGRSPRTFETAGEQVVDFGGSYRLTRNLDVTAGVRYKQDRDRLAPLPDGTKETQAVYVGTQFRF